MRVALREEGRDEEGQDRQFCVASIQGTSPNQTEKVCILECTPPSPGTASYLCATGRYSSQASLIFLFVSLALASFSVTSWAVCLVTASTSISSVSSSRLPWELDSLRLGGSRQEAGWAA